MLCGWTVLINDCETWTMNEQNKKKLEAMEMWTCRRLLKVSRTEMRSNINVLNQVYEKKDSTNQHKRKKWKNVQSLIEA